MKSMALRARTTGPFSNWNTWLGVLEQARADLSIGPGILKIAFLEMKLQHETCEEVGMVLLSQNYQLEIN